MKTCLGCGTEKPLTDYYVHKQMADGHLNYCKSCVRVRVADHRSRHLAQIQAYDRERNSLEHRRFKREWYNGLYLLKNPDKRAAHHAVSNAVRDGSLKKKPCAVCGCEKVEAHHFDYSKPLEVIWLCTPHHRQLHVAQKPSCERKTA